MRAYFLAAVTALALAGCQSADEKRAAETGEVTLANASMEDVARLTKAARTKTLMQPGRWQTELRIVAADLSAFPEGPARDGQMEAIKDQERASTGCLTANDLKPFDIDNLEKVAGKCVFARYVQAGGKIHVDAVCGEGATKTVLRAAGSLANTRYDVTIDQKTGTPGAAGYLGLQLRAKGTRIGNCVPRPAG